MKDDARSRKESVADRLRREILTLARPPGGAIDEAALAEEVGLSRPPLREVLRQMAGEGYVELRANRGAIVAPMDYATLRNFFLVAPMIYAAAARLATQNARPEQIEALRAVQARFRTAIEGGRAEDRVFWNDRFHALVGEMADDVYLMPSLRRLLIDHARIGMTFYRPRDPEMAKRLTTAAEQHEALIDCIAAGDEEGAAAVTRAHWTLSRDRIEMFVMPGGLDVPLGTRTEDGA